MGKRLIIMRHAKSSWSSGAATDHERPLNKRGRHAAPLVGARLRELGWIPDLVIASDSARTRETWQRMREEFPHPVEERYSKAFYHGGPAQIDKACAALTDDVSTLLVLGHNPGWERAVEVLCGRWVRMATANAALLQSDARKWSQTMSSGWTFADVLRPKEL